MMILLDTMRFNDTMKPHGVLSHPTLYYLSPLCPLPSTFWASGQGHKRVSTTASPYPPCSLHLGSCTPHSPVCKPRASACPPLPSTSSTHKMLHLLPFFPTKGE